MRIKLLVLLFFVLSSVSSQTYFKPGYVVKSVGDTLFGEVDYRSDTRMGEICTFRSSKTEIPVKFSPNEIVAYRFSDGKYYVSKNIDGRMYFLEFLINGKVSIYYLRNDIGDHYYIENSEFGLNEIEYSENYQIIDGKDYLVKTTKHIGLLNYYMQDAASIIPQIEKMKQPCHKNLISIAEKYHNAVCKDGKCIIYEKKLPPFKMNPEFFVGVVKINDVPSDVSAFSAGVLGHIWLPRDNEKLFLRTGLVKIWCDYQNQYYHYFKIPLTIEYIYPKGIIRPTIAYGVNFMFAKDSRFGHSVPIVPGLNIRLGKLVSWSLNCELDFDAGNFLIIPKSLFTTTFSTGLVLKF